MAKRIPEIRSKKRKGINGVTQTPTAQPLSTEKKIIYGSLGVAAFTGAVYWAWKKYLKMQSDKEEKTSFTDTTASGKAKLSKLALDNEWRIGTDTETIRDVMRSISSQEEWKAVQDSFEHSYNRQKLSRYMSEKMTASEYREMIQIVAVKPEKAGQSSTVDKYLAWAKRFKAAFTRSYWIFDGTDDNAILSVINEIPTQAAYKKVEDAYFGEYQKKLDDDLYSESEFGQYWDYKAIIKKKRSS